MGVGVSGRVGGGGDGGAGRHCAHLLVKVHRGLVLKQVEEPAELALDLLARLLLPDPLFQRHVKVVQVKGLLAAIRLAARGAVAVIVARREAAAAAAPVKARAAALLLLCG